MQGSFFVNIARDPRVDGRMLIKSGVVKAQLVPGRYLLEFQGNGYRFSNVLGAEQLSNFAFFDTVEAREQFIAELTAAPPESAEGPASPSSEPPARPTPLA